MNEIWRDIKDYEGLYQVSNLGRVRSVDRYVKHSKGGVRIMKGKILKPIKCYEYYNVQLCKNGLIKSMRIHRLVAMTFPDLVDWTEEAKGKPFEELEINHKDEHKGNNCVDNLEWCTAKYNMNYGTRTKRAAESMKGIYNRASSKPIYQYTLDGQFVAEYPSTNEAERQTGICASNIRKCSKKDKNYSHCGGYVWSDIKL